MLNSHDLLCEKYQSKPGEDCHVLLNCIEARKNFCSHGVPDIIKCLADVGVKSPSSLGKHGGSRGLAQQIVTDCKGLLLRDSRCMRWEGTAALLRAETIYCHSGHKGLTDARGNANRGTFQLQGRKGVRLDPTLGHTNMNLPHIRTLERRRAKAMQEEKKEMGLNASLNSTTASAGLSLASCNMFKNQYCRAGNGIGTRPRGRGVRGAGRGLRVRACSFPHLLMTVYKGHAPL